MIKLKLDNIVDVLVDLVPEFKEYEDFEPEYMIEKDFKSLLLDIFGRFLKERIENYPENDSVIKRVYKFLNEQLNESDNDEKVLDYIVGEIFENLSGSRKATEVSRKLLTGKALERFNKSEEYYGV